MRIRRTYLAAILAAASAAVAAILATSIASPTNVQYSARPHIDVPGVPNVDVKVPNLNAVENAIPDIPVPNINMPNVKINPGHVGAPGRGR